MSYWGDEIDGNDFASGAVGVAILWIKDRMFRDLDNVIAKSYPEQSVAVHLCCLRLLGVRFRKDLSVHFGKRDLARARQGFERWFELVKDKVPADRRDAIYASTEQEFLLFNEQIFRSPEADAISTLPPSL